MEPKEWKKFERNIKTLALNILFIPYNTKTIRVAYRSEHNNKHKKQVILLITDGKKSHYLAVTSLSTLLQGNSSNHEGDFFYCLNCFSSYTAKNKLKEHE